MLFLPPCTERRRREAIAAATCLTEALVDHLNVGYEKQCPFLVFLSWHFYISRVYIFRTLLQISDITAFLCGYQWPVLERIEKIICEKYISQHSPPFSATQHGLIKFKHLRQSLKFTFELSEPTVWVLDQVPLLQYYALFWKQYDVFYWIEQYMAQEKSA